jgi:hypothetical protein
MRTRLPFFLLAAAAGAPVLAQDTADFTAFLLQRYPVFSRASVADALAAARAKGLVSTPAEHLALKRAFHALRGAKGVTGSAWPMLLDAPAGPPLAAATDAIVNEVEFNDGAEFATPLLVDDARGSCAIVNDVDVYTFLSIGEFITAEVMQQGASPIVDSMLGIKSLSGQMIAFGEDISGTNFLSRTSIYLPAGIYQAEVGPWDSTSGGTYDLVFQRDAVNLTPLGAGPNNGTTLQPGAGAQTVWTFTLAQESTVSLVVIGPGGSADLHLAVQLADGRLWFLNDDSTGGLDPGADIDLPPGSYTAHVTDLTGGPSPYTILYTATPAVLPDLGSGQVQTGSVTGPESRRLYLLTNAVPGNVDLQTAGGTAPIGDTILYLFDSDLDYLCDCDDANPANPNDYYSRMQIGLPAGAYYVGVRGWDISAGDYTLTPAVGQPFPAVGTAVYGRNTASVPGGGRVALSTITINSGNSVRLDSTGGVNNASLYNFMTSTGQSLGVMEWSQDSTRIGPGGRARSRPTVGYLPRGTQYVLTWHRFEQALTNMVYDVFPPLHCEGGSLVGHGKQGDLAFLFGDFSPGAGVPFAGFGVDGFFCLPFGSPTLQTIGLRFYPASGAVTWLTCPTTPYGVYLQHGDLFAVPTTFQGAWRDRRQL